jgi:hypothetical protein
VRLIALLGNGILVGSEVFESDIDLRCSDFGITGVLRSRVFDSGKQRGKGGFVGGLKLAESASVGLAD